MLTGLAFEPPTRLAPVPLQSSPEDLREECAARAQICRLLSAVFVEEPGAAFLDALRSPDSLAALRDAGLSFDPDFLETETAMLVDQLACEFTTMFAASGGFPPVESVRLTGRYQQEPFFAVRQTYRQAGFAPCTSHASPCSKTSSAWNCCSLRNCCIGASRPSTTAIRRLTAAGSGR